MIKVKLLGVDEAISKINLINREAANKIQEQVAKSARNISRNAKKRAPVRIGKLKKYIKIKYENNRLVADIGPTKKVFYGMFAEFGTKNSPARPFLFPAWEQEKERYQTGIKKAVKELLARGK